jgi:uncharacterized protein YjbI with pentapeptide repeats
MNSTVVAAVIAAAVSGLTLVGTLVTQYLGRLATSRDIEKTLTEQWTRAFNERFATASGQLGDDKPAAVRLAGVYAMAGLADDWEANRQTCVDVLCAYLRLPYQSDPGGNSPTPEQLSFQAVREIRHTLIRVIGARLKKDTEISWQGCNLDFTGVVFDGGDFTGALFSGGKVDFANAQFTGGEVSFKGAKFSGSDVNFEGAQFTGGKVEFHSGEFSCGKVVFTRARFSGGRVSFYNTKFTGGEVSFKGAEFPAEVVDFHSAKFSGSDVSFKGAKFSGGAVSFDGAEFSGSDVSFTSAEFTGGPVSFVSAEFTLGNIDFRFAEFSRSRVSFYDAEFTGSTVSFYAPRVWSPPPIFPWTDTPPTGVKLPFPGAS